MEGRGGGGNGGGGSDSGDVGANIAISRLAVWREWYLKR